MPTPLRHFFVLLLAFFPSLALAQTPPPQPAPSGEVKVPLVFTGGHETVGEDRGRPVILIAAALNVPAEVFRATFKNVKPAGPGHEPDPEQVRKNKQALMAGLSPYGVTDDRLNEVSNYYRYNRSRGEMWRTTEASGYATVVNGQVTAITVVNSGSGYSAQPDVSVQGMPEVHLKCTVIYGTEFEKNGSISTVKLADGA